MTTRRRDNSKPDFDAIIVGAGFAGLYMLHRINQLGLSARVYEAADDVGGTWYWNRYPGARCDVPSFEYSYQFDPQLQQDWDWTERYASQPEILAYFHHVVERYGLRPNIQFNTRLQSAHYQESDCAWRIETDEGERITGRYLIMATGCLSARSFPEIEGLSLFEGTIVHTGNWPHEGLDVDGRSVGVIGTGSSGVQVSSALAQEAGHLTVFQRTPAYVVPANNRPLEPDEVAHIKANYDTFREEAWGNRAGLRYEMGQQSAFDVAPEERHRLYQERWNIGGLGFTSAFHDIFDDPEANHTAAEFVRYKIKEIVQDPNVAQKLMPFSFIGCKRLIISDHYYHIFNRDNVTLVNLHEEPLQRITRTGVEVGEREVPLDVLVFATGFDAVTGALLRVDIRGIDGQPLREKWRHGPKNYLGITIAGFPNLFTITGPGSPSVLSNMVASIEQHVNWIGDCIEYMEANDKKEITATRNAEEEWVRHVNEVADRTIYPQENSWYIGANIPGKPRVFMPYIGVPEYVKKCIEVKNTAYTGFTLR
ncbi:MAG: NAD(P)/FAD-dependent oxidoreductase [Spiribacter salinus]|uniref:NAD(P)/FAD-dependent oxidoreductase n=1 Tax=Spiribacter salinus TaxID=1335746 RepID=A0A540VTU6_9GAMM|nr:MAG: NAD(P)/FAD-dependent oxidoreductase [Spiribacter salinus]